MVRFTSDKDQTVPQWPSIGPLHSSGWEVKEGGKSTPDLCCASPEEIPEWQRPRRATGNCRNLQCGDDSYCGQMSHRTRGCIAWVWWGPQSGGSALLVVGFSVLVSILLCSLSMSGAALSTRLMGALRFRGSCSWLGERKGSWMVGYLCSCPGCAVTRHLEQQYDLWHFRVFGVSPACYRQLVVISDPAFKQGKFFWFFYPPDFVVGILEYRSVSWLVIIFLIDNKLQCKGVVIYYSFM